MTVSLSSKARPGHELKLEELRHLVASSKASGVGHRTIEDIYAEADRLAAEIASRSDH